MFLIWAFKVSDRPNAEDQEHHPVQGGAEPNHICKKLHKRTVYDHSDQEPAAEHQVDKDFSFQVVVLIQFRHLNLLFLLHRLSLFSR